MKRVTYLLITLIILAALSIVGLQFYFFVSSHQYRPPHVKVDAWTAVIMDAETGRVLYEKNPDIKLPPASTTKVMTAIVALERLPFGADVIPSKKAVYVEPTIAGLKEGVRYKLEDLLKAVLIKSANDAAVAVAERVAGSEKEFVKLMNEKAAQIGMEDTLFVSASGLPTGKKDAQHITARDLAKMMRYAARHKEILEYMSIKETNISGSDGANIYLKSHNKTLFLFEDAPWGKTGYTKQASRTFVGTDPSLKPAIVFGLLKSEDLWNDVIELKRKGLLARELSRRSWQDDLRDSFMALFGKTRISSGKSGVQGAYSTSLSAAPPESPKNAVTQKKHKRHKRKRAKTVSSPAKKQ